MELASQPGLLGIDVATPFCGRDLERPEGCRNTDLMSRHDSGCLDVVTSK